MLPATCQCRDCGPYSAITQPCSGSRCIYGDAMSFILGEICFLKMVSREENLRGSKGQVATAITSMEALSSNCMGPAPDIMNHPKSQRRTFSTSETGRAVSSTLVMNRLPPASTQLNHCTTAPLSTCILRACAFLTGGWNMKNGLRRRLRRTGGELATPLSPVFPPRVPLCRRRRRSFG